MSNKKYYWLKLKENFFEEDTIAWIEEQPNGKEYSLFYLKLCLKSLKTNGLLIRNVGQMIVPYDAKTLSKITNTDVDTVMVALELFKQIGLIQMLENGEIYLTQLENMVGSETSKAQLMRNKRAKDKQKTIEGNIVTKELPNCYTEIEIEKDIEIEKELEKKKREKKKTTDSSESSSSSSSSSSKKTKKVVKHKYGEYDNVLLSDEELDKLKRDFPTDYQERIDRLSEYVASTGKTYKNYLATIRAWARKEKQVQTYNQPQQQEKEPKNWWEETI